MVVEELYYMKSPCSVIDRNTLFVEMGKLIGEMPPPDKNKKTSKQSLLHSYINPGTVIAMNRSKDEEADSGVTYFVDEQVCYYYQTTGESQNLISLPNGVAEECESIDDQDSILLNANGEAYQTVTLVPSDSGNGEVSYVLVVQDETKPVVKIGLEVDQDGKGEDVYTFEEEEEGEEDEEGGGEDQKALDSVMEVDIAPKRIRGKRFRGSRPAFTCNVCSYVSQRRYLLLRHMKTHSEERPHKCSICERGFKTFVSLQNHVNMHSGIKPHVCKYCKAPFTTSGELVRHVRYKHTHEKPHKCTECDYASVELSKLRRHVRCHTGERPYQCPHCTYASPDTFKLKRHLRIHTGEKPYKCDYCNMCFTQSNSLKAHKRIHNVSEKPVYACELCPAKCGRKTDLRIHVQKLHTSDKPLKCKRCGKSFPDRYSCKIHNKTHEGEKSFKCELCPYASTAMRHLKSHMLKHTDEKPFVCDQCDQSFRQKQLLRRHQNLYHNPNYVPKPPKEKTHTCHECKRTFAHNGNLIRHLAVHDPDSGHRERALALKLGRQKKVKVVNGQFKESYTNEENSRDRKEVVKIGLNKDLKRGEVVRVADDDGHQYVVLEVIQLEDGSEQEVAVATPEFLVCDQEEEEEVEEEEEEEENEEELEEDSFKIRIEEKVSGKIKLEREVDSCFGFNEEEEEDTQDEERAE